MKRALVDEDIQPHATLEAAVDGRLDLQVGADPDEAALVDALQGKAVVFATSKLPLTRDVVERTDLEVIAKIGTGLDNVDRRAAAERGIPVTHTPGINAVAVAEHTVGLALAVVRNIVRNYEGLSEGTWRDEVELSSTIVGSTVGVVGFGTIGRRVAALLSGFDVDLLAYDPYVRPEDADLTGAELTTFEELLDRSDLVTINAELTEETRGMFGPAEFERMKSDAVLVNTARGPIVSEAALVEALREGRIAGAGLDVFETEPLPTTSPLHDFEQVVTTPHASGTTVASRNRAIETLVENTFAILDGRPVPERYVAVDAGTPG